MVTVLSTDNSLSKASNNTENNEIPYLKIVNQCKLTPNAEAILFKNDSTTYKELEEITNKLANYLKSQGIGSNSLVGIMTLPGSIMLTGMIGILKSGAAYVPIDPSYPTGRIKYIVNHSQVKILLTESSLYAQAESIIKDAPWIQNLVFLDSMPNFDATSQHKHTLSETWRVCSERDPEYTSKPDDLMVVLYTSGSTGDPKGVMLNHKGYMNRLVWHQKIFALSPIGRGSH